MFSSFLNHFPVPPLSESPAPLADRTLRPLGRGYSSTAGFLSRYTDSRAPRRRHPSLEASLQVLRNRKAASQFSHIGPSPNCLIQGISCPWNGAALLEFLHECGARNPVIQAVDILDVKAAFSALGILMPDVQFAVADAAFLPEIPEGSVQVLVQDHLLNCAPHRNHESIVREASRILDPDGVWIMNFSVNPSLGEQQEIDLHRVEAGLPSMLLQSAYCLDDLMAESDGSEGPRRLFVGRWFAGPGEKQLTVVTPPNGNFEFYFEYQAIQNLLARHRLYFSFTDCEEGVDSNGLTCLRCRTLVRHQEAVSSIVNWKGNKI